MATGLQNLKPWWMALALKQKQQRQSLSNMLSRPTQ